jgi:hypothetical protein
MRIGLSFDEFVVLLLAPLAGADPAFVQAAEMERKSLFPMTVNQAAEHLGSRGYDCKPQMLELLEENGVVGLSHNTEKPVELAVRAMHYSSRAGENVLDLFGGSGSTLIAAEQTGRRAFLMELDPLYCDVITQRFENFTGKKAERQMTIAERQPAEAAQ